MSKIKIFLDSGHGGTDRYNKGPTGYIEADGMLDVALKLRDELLSTGAFEVKMSREKDATVGVRERGNMAARWGADMFISEHSNATGWANNTTKRGVDVFYSVDIPSDRAFANNMSKAIAEAMGTKNNGAKTWESTKYPGEDYLGVIDAAQDGGVKHVLLIENGFHDNAQDEAILKDPAKRTAIAKAQAKVICDFYKVQYPVIKKEEPEMWKKKIVQEAFDLGLITDKTWVDKADEGATVWFVVAVVINVFKKLKK
jgi:N-acetylmuramoyl-L-alanine amidase